MAKMRVFTDSEGVERVLPQFVTGPGTFQIIVYDDWSLIDVRMAQVWAMVDALQKLMAERGVDHLPFGQFELTRDPGDRRAKEYITGRWAEPKATT